MSKQEPGTRLQALGLTCMLTSAGCLSIEPAALEVDGASLELAPASAATYEVPVDASLTSFALYPVGHVKWEAKAGMRTLEYTLPAELVGKGEKVELSGPDLGADWVLTGEAGTATCSAQGQELRCNESLPGVPVNVGAVEGRVLEGELPPQKLAVTKVFAGDPLGILYFTPR